jgi:hypothetical protein
MIGSFDRIIIVLLENETRERVLMNSYMRDLRRKGVFLENSYGVTHPSQPNYIAVVAGDTFGFNSDNPLWVGPYPDTADPNSQPPVPSIVDLLENKGFTWKSYAEKMQPTDIVPAPVPLFNMQTQAFPAVAAPPSTPSNPWFARRHVPFLSFPNIVSNPLRAANIVNAEENFDADLAAGNLPEYIFYSPDLLNDGHSTMGPNGTPVSSTDPTVNVNNIATFLQAFLTDDPIKKFPPKTLIAITFDEAFPYTAYDIYTLLIGDMLEAGTSRKEPYNHYSLLRTVEDNFGLGTLGRNDATATPYWFVDERASAAGQ